MALRNAQAQDLDAATQNWETASRPSSAWNQDPYSAAPYPGSWQTSQPGYQPQPGYEEQPFFASSGREAAQPPRQMGYGTASWYAQPAAPQPAYSGNPYSGSRPFYDVEAAAYAAPQQQPVPPQQPAPPQWQQPAYPPQGMNAPYPPQQTYYQQPRYEPQQPPQSMAQPQPQPMPQQGWSAPPYAPPPSYQPPQQQPYAAASYAARQSTSQWTTSPQPPQWRTRTAAYSPYGAPQPYPTYQAYQNNRDATIPENGSRQTMQDEYISAGRGQQPPESSDSRPSAAGALDALEQTAGRRRRRSSVMPEDSEEDIEKIDSIEAGKDFGRMMEEEDPEPRSAAKGWKKQRRGKTARRGKEKEEAFWEEEPEKRGSDRQKLSFRLTLNLILFLLVGFLSMAGVNGGSLPAFLQVAQSPSRLLWLMVLLTALSAVVSGETIANGFLSLFRSEFGADGGVMLTVTAALIQGTFAAMRPQLWMIGTADLFLPVASLSLALNTIGKLIRSVRVEETIQLVQEENISSVITSLSDRQLSRACTEDTLAEPTVVTKTKAEQIHNGLDGDAESMGRVESAFRAITPIAAMVSLALSLLMMVMGRGIYESLGVFVACLTLTLPASSLIASQLPLFLANGVLTKWKAGLSGYRSTEEVARADTILVQETDLFPAGCAVVQYFHLVGVQEPDKPILEGAALANATNGCLKGIFDSSIPDKTIIPKAENLKIEDGMGFSAWIRGNHVLLGDRNLMMRYHITPVSEQEEKKFCAKENTDLLYLASGGEISGIILMHYQVDREIYQALELLTNRDSYLCIQSSNPNLSIQRIAKMYDYPQDMITALPCSMFAEAERAEEAEDPLEEGTFCDGSLESEIQAIAGAGAVIRSSMLEVAVMLLSVILGFTITVFCAVSNSMSSLSWLAVVVYQSFWLLVELILPLFRGI